MAKIIKTCECGTKAIFSFTNVHRITNGDIRYTCANCFKINEVDLT